MENFAKKELSKKLLGMAFKIHNILGPGLLESAYEEALCVELLKENIPYCRQKPYPLYYRGELIGSYIADLVVNDEIILELKAVQSLSRVMEAQTINYLKLSNLEVGYLINFRNIKVDWKRFVNLGSSP